MVLTFPLVDWIVFDVSSFFELKRRFSFDGNGPSKASSSPWNRFKLISASMFPPSAATTRHWSDRLFGHLPFIWSCEPRTYLARPFYICLNTCFAQKWQPITCVYLSATFFTFIHESCLFDIEFREVFALTQCIIGTWWQYWSCSLINQLDCWFTIFGKEILPVMHNRLI